MKRSPAEFSPGFDGIPAKIPTPIRQKSPIASRSFMSSSNPDPDTFYLLKESPGGPSQVTGEKNLISHFGLQHSFDKFSSKKVKEQLSAFLPGLPGMIDTPGAQDNSSLQMCIEKPPIVGKPLNLLSGQQLTAFKLYPGPIAEQYKWLHSQPPKKHKKKKQKRDFRPPEADPMSGGGTDAGGDGVHDMNKKHKRKKEKGERKDKKKDKKKKKSKSSPKHGNGVPAHTASGPGRP